jgi:hypothetical protein
VVAVLLAVAVVGTLLYVLASRPPQSLSQPATRVMPFVTPSTFPTEIPTLAPTHSP